MPSFIISLDEVDRVKKANGLRTNVDLAEKTGVSRNTWIKALRDRNPTPQVLNALAGLGARPQKILILDEPIELKAVA